jgi:hypothetical protein
VPVFLGDAAVTPWEREHARPLTAAERYAVVKMALFQAFDERPAPTHMQAEVRVRAADIDTILQTLGIE